MRPKCPKCARPLDRYSVWRREDEMVPFGVACNCGWSRRVSRAAIIRLAAQKPETCKWRDSAQPIGCLLTNKRESTPKFCSGCGKPVEVVG